MLHIRSANASDIELLITLEQTAPTAAHWSRNQYEQIFAPEALARLILIAEQRGPVGSLVAICATEEWELENIVVSEASRRQGIGSLLIRELIARARPAAASSVMLEVRESNRAARFFYESLGFEEYGRRDSYYRNPREDAVLYRICL